jgi:hypothetical protein
MISLFPLEQFPVRFNQRLATKVPKTSGNSTGAGAGNGPAFVNFPVFFPVRWKMEAETGSLWTAWPANTER